MTHLLVMYDISDDKLRYKVADACLDYGLQRVQYSAFVGELGRVHQRELEIRIRELVGRRSGHVRLIPLDMHTWQRQRVVGWPESAATNGSTAQRDTHAIADEETRGKEA